MQAVNGEMRGVVNTRRVDSTVCGVKRAYKSTLLIRKRTPYGRVRGESWVNRRFIMGEVPLHALGPDPCFLHQACRLESMCNAHLRPPNPKQNPNPEAFTLHALHHACWLDQECNAHLRPP